MRLPLSLLLIALLFGSSFAVPAHAQDAPNGSECASVLATRFGTEGAPPSQACTILAVALEDTLTSAQSVRRVARSQVSARDLQLPQSQVGYDVGTPSQGSAVPSMQPVAVGGGNLSAVGTDGGTSTLATLALNPSSFFVDALQNADLATRLGDIGDVTLIVPVDQGGTTSSIDYVGLRGRVNVTGLTRGGKRYNEVVTQFSSLLQQSGVRTAEIERLLTTTSDVRQCTAALVNSAGAPNQDAVQAACGGTYTKIPQSAFDQLRTSIEAARKRADRSFVGLDLRSDFGDPSLGAVAADSAKGTRFYAGLAAGRKFQRGETAQAGVGFRTGLRYTDLTMLNQTNFTVEGALDLQIERFLQQQRLQATAGLEVAYGNAGEVMDAALQTDYLRLRGSVNVPFTSAYSLSVNAGTDLVGDLGSTLNVKLNWNLLWPEQ